jgi:hypothetical protein
LAQKVRTLFIDDLDGSPAEGTVRFGLDDYEIDLNADHARTLRGALARYVHAARRTPASRRPARGRRPADAGQFSNDKVRAWAKSQGIKVKERGRMPA